MRLGFMELLVILAIIVLLFGAKQIPKVSTAVLQATKDFKKELKKDEAAAENVEAKAQEEKPE